MKKYFPIKAGLLALGLFAATGCAKNKEVEPSITNIAVTNPDFQELEDAAIRGDVAVLLGNKNPNDPQGNYTVFAPTNAAFSRLGLNTAQDLAVLQQSFLQNTLYYHVYSGSLPGSALTSGSTSNSALGVTRRIIRRTDGTLYVNGSQIVGTDVKAANGLIHPIDKVLLATKADVLNSALALQSGSVFVKPELTFLVEAVVYCNLQDALKATPGSAPLTVFAPTDQAFKDLGVLLGVPLNQPSDIRKLPVATVTAVLLNHVVGGTQGGKFTPELPENTSVASAGGAPVALGAFKSGVITMKGSGNTVPANMVIPDVQCTNGVVHVIDRVLLPL
ncbi:fasciclin domain-containing protein [Microvirga sp. STS02]|uniref:fasciclin domain-containing protein n=1 Tax=Hymenobacter negativus TaxID=2795026 RepID=UPI0018DE535F|nr:MULTISPECIES: fasciclin domain-containing protein [Bacteria]MBH8567503.1 fasciclin domain-containing protein [Hymenobacter negativus]MBR7207235.1 fasciclin domain-containing protein [Microvirga sp. STS02]